MHLFLALIVIVIASSADRACAERPNVIYIGIVGDILRVRAPNIGFGDLAVVENWMAKLAINKTSLKKQRDQLKLFQRFLPSLDLKRQQLLTEYKQVEMEYRLQDKEQVREYFTRLTGLAKNLNYAAYESEDYKRLTREIEELAASVS
jgi:hypothetical protein